MKDRQTAFQVLYDVLYNDGYSNIALAKHMEKSQLNNQQRVLCAEIVMGTLRNHLLLQWVVNDFAKNKVSPSIRVILEAGIYQLLFMERIPEHAICNESVILAQRYGGKKSKGFVNAILRNVIRQKKALLQKMETLPYNIRYSCSKELVDGLMSLYQKETTRKILESFLLPPKTWIRLNTFKDSEEHIIKHIEKDGLRIEKDSDHKHFYIQGANPIKTDAYQKGLFTFQDANAQLFAPMLQVEKNQNILDACAAPGGKTTHIAQLMNNTGNIVACDVHEHKIQLIKKNAMRMGFDKIDVMQRDMTDHFQEWTNTFDGILIDAPCSGLGTCQKRPEIKWQYRFAPSLVTLQQNILEQCSKYVKNLGVILYGTCTLLKEENEEIVENFLNQHPHFILEEEKKRLPDGKAGGFYMAKLRRNENETTHI